MRAAGQDRLPDAGAGLPARLDAARGALAEARNDFERLQLRDTARALEAAAAILDRREIQVEASLLVQDAERAIDKANPPVQGKRTDLNFVTPRNDVPNVVLRQIRLAHSGITDTEYEQVKEQAQAAGEPVTRQALKDLSRKKRKGERDAKAQAEREERAQAVPADASRITCCGVGDYSMHVAERSVDSIVTDPPYPREYQPLYRDLAAFAAHALRPGGTLLAMAGHPYLPEIFEHMRHGGGDRLAYRWCIAYHEPRATQQVHSALVTVQWKPILAYTRSGKPAEKRATDYIDKGAWSAKDKAGHKWGQAVSGLRKLIHEWIPPGGVLCDPFCGAGSTLVAARSLGYEVIGADIDEASVRKTRGALQQVAP